jgi:penicillin amidase
MSEVVVRIPGLSSPATITLDRWGVAHIRAESFLEMFFVQGFNAARDRLWQLDLWRKRGLGLLAADYGPGYLEQDRAARLFLYRGDMEREWASYSADAQEICSRFVAGINAYIELCAAEPGRLPTEFAAMSVKPARWSPEDVVRIRSHSPMRNALSEVVRSNVLASADPATDEFRQSLQPQHNPLEGLTSKPKPLPLECLDVFKLATTPVTFSEDRLKATMKDARSWRRVTPLGDVVHEAMGQGSNNWAVAGSRTSTGRPILANDPHRAHATPSLRYVVHIASPEFNGIGAGEPALPGISIGHNGTSAFGLTLFFGHDQEDVYVYETHPDDPDLYRYGDGWERIRLVEEKVDVRGFGETVLSLRFTRHGPIVADYASEHRAVAVRTVWAEPGTAPYFRSIASMRAKSFDKFRELMWGWGVPAVNQVYADVTGDVGWTVAGFSPVRPNWDGLLPVAGDGRHEWRGFLDGRELPWSLNPDHGYVATANEFNLPDNWSKNSTIGYEWTEPSRAERISEFFSTTVEHSVADSRSLQTDVVSMPARRLIALLEALSGRDGRETNALKFLREWDGRLDAKSGPGALFEVWWAAHLRPLLFAQLIDDPRVVALIGPGNVATTLAHLEARKKAADPTVNTLLLDSLRSAATDCERRMGDDPSSWAWGRVHQAMFEHAVSAVNPELAANLNVGPLPIGGSDSTPMNGMYRPSDFRLTIGASFRIVTDVGAWDNSVYINTPGQSGDSRSPHYQDLAPAWARGDYVPLLYSDEAIEEAAVVCIRLLPTG